MDQEDTGDEDYSRDGANDKPDRQERCRGLADIRDESRKAQKYAGQRRCQGDADLGGKSPHAIISPFLAVAGTNGIDFHNIRQHGKRRNIPESDADAGKNHDRQREVDAKDMPEEEDRQTAEGQDAKRDLVGALFADAPGNLDGDRDADHGGQQEQDHRHRRHAFVLVKVLEIINKDRLDKGDAGQVAGIDQNQADIGSILENGEECGEKLFCRPGFAGGFGLAHGKKRGQDRGGHDESK